MNEEIRSAEVRLIDAEGNQVGIVSKREALRIAEESELDLVEISPNANPPVCRVMNYGKYLFEVNKQNAARKKKQKPIQVKEMKFRPGTEEGDYQVKLRNLIRFLQTGDKAKITIRFRGREITHMELGAKLMERLQIDLEAHGTIEQMPKLEGKQMVMVVNPKKAK